MLAPNPSVPLRPSRNRQLWDLIVPYVRPHKKELFLALLLNALPGIAITIQTVAPKYLVDEILIAPGISQTTRYQRLLGFVGVYLFAAIFCRMLAWYGSYRIFTRVREQIFVAVRSHFFRHINHLCLNFHRKHSSGELFTYVFGSPLYQISSYYHLIALNLPNAICTFSLSIIWIFFWDWALTLVLVTSVLVSVLMMHRAGSRIRSLYEDFQKMEGTVTGRVSDILRGTREVKIHSIEENITANFRDQADLISQKTLERDLNTHRENMNHEVIGYLCFLLLCVVGAWRYLHHHLTTGEFLAYLGAYGALQAPVGLLFSIITARASAQASVARLTQVLNTGSTTPDPEHDEAKPPCHGNIVLKDVSFCYDNRRVLENLNFTIPYGQRIALVGPSGAGKSTLAKLILRLYDPEDGSIQLAGIDYRRFRGSELRRRFGVVPQDPFFFRATVRENLLLVKPEASEKELKDVCRCAHAWEFISEMPQGLDTILGEGGWTLSGGQRQRLAIARALLNEPQFFVFDEATSALDTLSEQLIQQSLSHILQGRTAIFIAHRLSTVKNCDRILVLNDKQVEQDGTFEGLMKQPGLFRQMVETNSF